MVDLCVIKSFMLLIKLRGYYMYSMTNRYFEYEIWKFMIALFIITAITTAIIFYLLWARFKLKYEKNQKNVDSDNSKKTTTFYRIIKLLSIFVIAPFIETLIFQYSIFRLIEVIYRGNSRFLGIAFIISALVFAAVHGLPDKDWKSAITRFPLGLALSCIFSFSVIKKYNPIITTTIFHAIWNTTALALLPVGAKFIVYLKKDTRGKKIK